VPKRGLKRLKQGPANTSGEHGLAKKQILVTVTYWFWLGFRHERFVIAYTFLQKNVGNNGHAILLGRIDFGSGFNKQLLRNDKKLCL
jgi:hypothetical protein